MPENFVLKVRISCFPLSCPVVVHLSLSLSLSLSFSLPLSRICFNVQCCCIVLPNMTVVVLPMKWANGLYSLNHQSINQSLSLSLSLSLSDVMAFLVSYFAGYFTLPNVHITSSSSSTSMVFLAILTQANGVGLSSLLFFRTLFVFMEMKTCYRHD